MKPQTTKQTELKAFSGRTLLWGAVFVLLVTGAAWTWLAPALAAGSAEAAAAPIRGYELLDGQAGWLWQGNDLDRTEDGGRTWQRITPNAASSQDGSAGRILAVHFADPSNGWMLLAAGGPVAASIRPDSSIQLAATDDGGTNWRLQALPGDLAAILASAKAVYLQPLSSREGWIAASLAQSANFSRGALWYTADGGATWSKRELPLGEAPQFGSALAGFVAGGPAGNDLWRTLDGGANWQPVAVPRPAGAGERVQVYPPIFTHDGHAAVLPLLVRGETGQRAEWYVSSDGGSTWAPAWALVQEPGNKPVPLLAEVDARAWLLTATSQTILPPVQPLPFFANTDVGGDLRLVQVKMVTAEQGWALAETSGAASRLLATEDGGQSWQPLMLPPAGGPADNGAGGPAMLAGSLSNPAPLALGSRTAVLRGAGFDVCDLPSTGELETWRSASPYRAVNLYLGGILRFCDNDRLTAGAIAELAGQGWTFIPTWVGPQAPCSVYSRRFSSDPGEAYGQGSAEAEAAIAAARSLGLSEADGSGTILYYDLESFDGTSPECVAAAQAFVSGWTDRLHANGSQSGLYSSACNPRMDRFVAIASPPDAVWVAQWNRDFFDPAMTVWNIACLDDSLWSRSQRIRQYTGGHDETWGGVTLNIDSNVLDGIVADPGMVINPPTPTATPTSTATPTPTPTPTPQPVVLMETPNLQPAYAGGMCGAGWHKITNERGQPAYLAANRQFGTIPPPEQTPQAAYWASPVPSSGSYRVDVYIPNHGPIAWECPPAALAEDTASAHYTVYTAQGEQVVTANQASVRGGWLTLGAFPFTGGQAAIIRLGTATDEIATTRTVAASAVRLERQADTQRRLYLPLTLRSE